MFAWTLKHHFFMFVACGVWGRWIGHFTSFIWTSIILSMWNVTLFKGITLCHIILIMFKLFLLFFSFSSILSGHHLHWTKKQITYKTNVLYLDGKENLCHDNGKEKEQLVRMYMKNDNYSNTANMLWLYRYNLFEIRDAAWLL